MQNNDCVHKFSKWTRTQRVADCDAAGNGYVTKATEKRVCKNCGFVDVRPLKGKHGKVLGLRRR